MWVDVRISLPNIYNKATNKQKMWSENLSKNKEHEPIHNKKNASIRETNQKKQKKKKSQILDEVILD